MVISALRERRRLRLLHLLLANLCCSNLVSSVLVKSISIVHTGYVVAADQGTQSSIAFCR